LALAFLGGATFVIKVVAGPSFAGSAPVLEILGAAMIATFVLSGWSFALLSLQHHRGLLIANAIAFVVSCALTATLASANGAQGAAVATLCGETALAVGVLIALVSRHPELRPGLRVAFKVALAAAPAAVLATVPDVSSLVRALLALAAYAVLLLLTRAVPPELMEIVSQRFIARA
jgi:O-antigen/teichoic acid export membrane protein